MSEAVRVPRLRFPEFRNEYRGSTLGDVASWTSGGTPSKDNFSYWDGDIPWVSASSMTTSEIIGADHYITEAGLRNGSKLAATNSLLILVRGSMLYNRIPVSIAVKDVAFNQDVKALLLRKDVVPRFLLHFLQSIEEKLLNLVVGTGIGAGKLDTITLKAIQLNLPGFAEQQKIAGFLTAVDEKIAAIKKKKELLEQYKKGAMQAIFSQRIRFRFRDPSGNPYPDWKEKRLSDVMIESRIVGSKGDIAQKITVKLWGRGVFAKSDESLGSANTQYYKRKAGQFIYSKLDFLNCAFGIVPKELNGYESTIDLPAFDIKPNHDSRFLLEAIKQKNFYKRHGEAADGSRKAKRIHAETFLSFPLALPTYDEQRKIAGFLSTLDQRIEIEAKKLEQAQQFKKALLQQMFV